MEVVIYLSGGILISLLLCYVVQLYMPKGKQVNYWIATIMLLSGIGGWISVWLGFGWLTTGIVTTEIVSSGLCILSFFFFLFTFTLNFANRSSR